MTTSYAPKNPFSWLFAFLISLCLLGLLVSMASCSSTKDLTKKQSETKTETEVKSVTTRTIVETAQEDVKVAGDTLTREADIAEVIEHPISIEDENLKLTVEVDPKTKKLKATAIKKEKIIPVNVKKVTVEKVEADTKTKATVKEKEKDLHKETESGINFNWLWWLLLLLLIPIWKYRANIFGHSNEH